MPYFKYKDKNVYFEEIGDGFPLILLHGNSVSSKMFVDVVELYKSDFRVILIDFLGHGRSDRLDKFPVDFWYDEAMQVIELVKHNNYGKVNIIGTSGGALAALNVALEQGDIVNKVVADSFEGEKSFDYMVESISNDRQQSKADEEGRAFWEYCHGEDWESVVDNDTDVIIRHDKTIKNFFHKDLSQLDIPVLLSASLEDPEIVGTEKVFKALHVKIANSELHLFSTGGHPALLSNAKEFSDIAKKFLADEL